MVYKLSCLKSTERLELKPLKCSEVELKCSYGTAKRVLHGIACQLIGRGEICTYELYPIAKEVVKAKIYANNPNSILERIQEHMIQEKPKPLGESTPSYSGTENFLDALISVSLERAGFRHARGAYVDIERNIAIKKRTILDHEGHPILFLDYIRLSPSIAEDIRKELEINEFQELRKNEGLRREAYRQALEYVGKTVFTWWGKSYTQGRVVGIDNCFVGDRKIDGKPLHEYWREKKSMTGIKVDENEYPVFIVEINEKKCYYPPSPLKPAGGGKADPPYTRFKEIEKLREKVKREAEGLLSELGYKNIKFEPFEAGKVFFKPNFYRGEKEIDKESVVKLVYKREDGSCVSSYISPLFAFSEMKYYPYAGREENLSLVLIYPSDLEDFVKADFVEMLKNELGYLNLGSIKEVETISYAYNPDNLTESLISLEEAIAEHARQDSLIIAIIPSEMRDKFYTSAKTKASEKGCHTQLIETNTIERIKEERIKEKKASVLLANICAGIYIEFLIQKKISEGKPAGPLTWKLHSPADGEGKTMYVGLDISRKKGIAGAAFIMFDSYGELMNARILELASETITEDDYYNIFKEMVKEARRRNMERIVILRDGPPRTEDELDGCLRSFNRVTKDLGYKPLLEYISVIKSVPARMFGVDGQGAQSLQVHNPLQGAHHYLYKLRHLNRSAHEVLIISSRPKDEKRCTKPVILRVYELDGRELREEDAIKIAEEYLSLTRLNFWNLETGASRLALPVKMAHILSYMKASGIPVRGGH